MTFSGSLLDPADRYRNDENWIKARLDDSQSRYLVLWTLQVLVTGDEALALVWLTRSDVENELPGAFAAAPVFLGVDAEGAAYFAVDADGVAGETAPFPGSGQFLELRATASRLQGGEAGILARARSMVDWHKRHGFCACCGQISYITRGGYMRKCSNLACGAEHFPRVDPVVIMLIIRGDNCLLGRQTRFPDGMFSVLAGFIEPGETIEEAVRRESHEEAGIRVGAVRYVASQPWPFPSNLMIGCEAEALTEEITLDTQELEAAFWVSRADIRRVMAGDKTLGFSLPASVAIARQLLDRWVGE
jgi:NAD+ diphosphatase